MDRKNVPLKHRDNTLFLLMLLSGIVGLVASFQLSYDAYILAGNPNAEFSCDLNSVVSCGKVAQTWQAHLFGFPNAFIGMMAEPVVITIGMAGLLGAKFPKLFMFLAQVIYFIGFVFAMWLFYQSAFVIKVFCPWCLLVSVSTTFTLFTIFRYNVLKENLYLSKKLSEKLKIFTGSSGDTFILSTVLSIIASIILLKYGFKVFGL